MTIFDFKNFQHVLEKFPSFKEDSEASASIQTSLNFVITKALFDLCKCDTATPSFR